MSKRKKAENTILTYIKKITNSDKNIRLYKNLFKRMNDEEFHQFMLDLKNGTKHLSIIVPPGSRESMLSTENNIKIAKELGHSFETRLEVSATKNSPAYTTDKKYIVYKQIVRRPKQLLVKKLSVAEDTNTIDNMTGQVTGKSKTSTFTYQETQLLAAEGFKDSIIELLKFRGGDIGGRQAMENHLEKFGTVSMDTVNRFSTGVVSKKTLSAYLNAAHLKNTINK